MTLLTRRTALIGAAATVGLAACGNGIGSDGAAKLDARVDAALNFLSTNFPGTRDLDEKAVGKLVMPLVTEASFGIGGSFGRGALRGEDKERPYVGHEYFGRGACPKPFDGPRRFPREVLQRGFVEGDGAFARLHEGGRPTEPLQP